MKVITWNVNGLRSIYAKGLLDWLKKEKPDILCLQEIKVSQEKLPAVLEKIKGYYAYFSHAQKPGYSGVAIYTKNKPLKITGNLNSEKFDTEGRFLRLDFKNFILINLYLPHGGRQKENLEYKLNSYKILFSYLKKIDSKRPVILVGDFNIAHAESDLARPKQNQANIMFTPAERKQLDHLIALNYLDTFRTLHQENGHYTWWPYRYGLRERNLGWRLDYLFISKSIAKKLKQAFIRPNVKGSDHCPAGIEIKI